MQFQQLAYFLAVAETRHFTRAAERCRVAQPSLSKQIQALEDELGAALFIRARGNITLTAAGEALLPLAQRILSDLETARSDVQELADMRRGRVRLGATPSLCSGLVADVMARFHARFPGIDLHVDEGGSRDLIRALGRGQLDLALIILPLHSSDPQFVTQPILRENLVVASPADRPLPSGRSSLSVSDLRDHQLVMFRQGYDLRDATLQVCRAAGFEPQLAVEGGEMDAILSFVEAGLGLAVVPSMALKHRPRLRAIPLDQPRLLRTVALAHRRDVTPSQAVNAFRRSLMRHLERLHREGPGQDLEVLALPES